MLDREIVLEGLSLLCNGNVKTAHQCQCSGIVPTSQLGVKQLICKTLDTEASCPVSCGHYNHICCLIEGKSPVPAPAAAAMPRSLQPKGNIGLDQDFFDPQFDYDYTNIRDTQIYYRGGEVYTRPCGWMRIALKILDKYNDGNSWLGHTGRGTQSVSGEWPVSYHGTSKTGVEGIVGGHYKPGSGQAYGRGIYSTPFMTDAEQYAKSFVSKVDGKTYKVILQNRINPAYREKYYNDRYWLVRIPDGTSAAAEQRLVERAIRPYGILFKAV